MQINKGDSWAKKKVASYHWPNGIDGLREVQRESPDPIQELSVLVLVAGRICMTINLLWQSLTGPLKKEWFAKSADGKDLDSFPDTVGCDGWVHVE